MPFCCYPREAGANQTMPSAILDKRGQKCFQMLSEKASLQIKRNQIQHRMQTLLEVQKIYIPGVASLEARLAHENASHTSQDDSSATGMSLLIHF